MSPDDVDSPIAAHRSSGRLQRVRHALAFSRISGVYVYILIVIAFSFWLPSTFDTTSNWQNIAGSQAVTAIVTVGLLFPLAAGQFDLSVGSTIGLAGMMSAYLADHGAGTVSAILIALALGVAVGGVNAVLIVGLRLDSFIATLGMSSILLGITLAITNGQEIIGLPSAFQSIGTTQVFGLPIAVMYLVAIGFIAWWALEHTTFGRFLFAVGGGRDAAKLAGVKTGFEIATALIVCGGVAAIGGVVVTASLGAADPNIGAGYLLPAFASAALGATQFRDGRFNVPGAILANYLLATGVTGLQLAGAQDWVTYVFNGAALVVALALAVRKGRLRPRFGSRVRRIRRPVSPN